jgi:hypothetical protein
MSAIIETVTGKFVDIENPNRDDITLVDIAWALSRISRFAGHTITPIPYTVAQHSVLVARMCYEETDSSAVALFGLLHDAAEIYTGDIPSPVKRIPGLKEQIDIIEGKLLDVIFNNFVYRTPTKEEWVIIKHFDKKACQIESYAFMSSRGLAPSWNNNLKIDLLDHYLFESPKTALDSYKDFIKEFDFFAPESTR